MKTNKNGFFKSMKFPLCLLLIQASFFPVVLIPEWRDAVFANDVLLILIGLTNIVIGSTSVIVALWLIYDLIRNR